MAARTIACIYIIWGFLLVLPAQAADTHDLRPLLPRIDSAKSPLAAGIRQALVEGRIDAVLVAARQLTSAEPDNSEGPLWMGIAEIRRGNIYSAIRCLMRARSLEPGAPAAKALGVAYYMIRQHRLFEAMMREAISKDPADFAPYYFLGRFYDSDWNNFSKAGELFEKAIALEPAHFRSHYHLGHTLESRGEAAAAESAYMRALDLARKAGMEFAPAHLGLARLLSQANRNDEALGYARRAAGIDPQDAPAHTLCGKILSALGRDAEAIRDWEAAVKLDPTDSGTLYRLSRAYTAAGQPQKARETLARFKRIVAVYGTN